MGDFGRFTCPEPYNEEVRTYAPGSADREEIKKAIAEIKANPIEIPCFVGGKEIKTGDIRKQVSPSDHKTVVCTFHQATEEVLQQSIDYALESKEKWESLPLNERQAIFLKAADLLATTYRYELNAATMLGQGKTVHQAEIDAIAEMIDFLRFNPKYIEQIYAEQPPKNSTGVWNRSEYLPLE